MNLCNAATCSNKWRAEPNGGTVHAADASLHGDGDGLKEQQKWRFMVLSCIDTAEVILSDWWIYKVNQCFIMKMYIQDKYIDIVLIHSCNPAVLVAASEGGGGSRRRRKPARNRIVSLSYLFPIQTVTKLLTTSQGLKAPWGRPPKGKGLTLLRQDTCTCPGPSTIIGIWQGFLTNQPKIGFCSFSPETEIYIYTYIGVTKAAGLNENETN